jgi:linoleoyl-CoA desaturase
MVSLIFTAVLGVAHLSDFVQHPKAEEDGKLLMSWPKLQMQTSIDYNTESTFLNWTLGGFNAHALHHLLPNISHVHYINILPIFRDLCIKHGIVYMEMPYHKALASHFRFLKGMGNHLTLPIKKYERQAY